MCHLNINSIQNKFEELASLIKKSTVQLMVISESIIDSSYPNIQFNIPGYGLYRNDRKKGGGGVLAYVSSDLVCERIKLEPY
jgi:exonuclease III